MERSQRRRSSTSGRRAGSPRPSATTARRSTHARSLARWSRAARSKNNLRLRRGGPRRRAAEGPASAAAIPPSAASRRSGSRSTVSSRSSTPPCPPRGICSHPVAASPPSPSTRSRTAGSSASSSIAPPAASVHPNSRFCRCGLEPEAELITRGGVAPSAGEVADNARSSSAHLRVGRKLESTEGDED